MGSTKARHDITLFANTALLHTPVLLVILKRGFYNTLQNPYYRPHMAIDADVTVAT